MASTRRAVSACGFMFLPPSGSRPEGEERSVMADPRTDTRQQLQPGGWLLHDVSNAMVPLHKERFGRGPPGSDRSFARADALLCVMDDALLPAETKMVDVARSN